MKMKAKFHVDSLTVLPNKTFEVKLSATNEFLDLVPKGSISMILNTPACVNAFTPGVSLSLTFETEDTE